jgi:hypothetical protein
MRIGWSLPAPQPSFGLAHGPLMVSGFLGTLIGLERAVAFGRPAAYAAPIASALGGLALLADAPAPAAPLLMTLGGIGLAAVFASAFARHTDLHVAVMGVGALAWLTGNLLWLTGTPIYGMVPWLGGFLVLTIVGERLELTRLTRPAPGSRAAFLTAVAVYVAGLALSIWTPHAGARLEGLGMLGLALWLLRFDIARHTVRQAGLSRFIAISLLTGYVWLGIAGSLRLLLAGAPATLIAGPLYDATLHALFLGFVFAMIFAHAPIILPAVLGGAVAYRPDFYTPLALLNLSLIVRLCGDLGGHGDLRRWGGLLGVVAVLAFLANTIRTARDARSR